MCLLQLAVAVNFRSCLKWKHACEQSAARVLLTSEVPGTVSQAHLISERRRWSWRARRPKPKCDRICALQHPPAADLAHGNLQKVPQLPDSWYLHRMRRKGLWSSLARTTKEKPSKVDKPRQNECRAVPLPDSRCCFEAVFQMRPCYFGAVAAVD